MEDSTKKTGKRKRLFIVSSILGLTLVLGIFFYIRFKGFETTDNAQIDADIIPIRTSVSGYVKEVRFTDNSLVKKGDTLLIINDDEFQARVLQAEAALENAKANLVAVKNNADAGDLNASAAFLSSETTAQNIDVAKTRLNKINEDYKRIKNMYASKAATKAELDAIEAELAVAEAQFKAATNQYKASSAQSAGVKSQATGQKSMIALAEALVKQRTAELTLARTQLGYTIVKAPCDGLVSKRSVDQGQFVTVGTPVCSAIDNTTLWVTANFKETQIEYIKMNQSVEVKVDAYPSLSIKGKVDSYIGATGAKFSLLPPDNSTGNFVKIVQRVPVRIKLTGLTRKQRALLLPGLSAYVSVSVK
ncbi:MAG: HlyD family secretion protein [Flavobacteriales bacterium]